MNRTFFREYSPQSGSEPGESDNTERKFCDRLYIAFTGLSKGAGTTLIASSFAFYLMEKGKKVQYIQCMNPTAGGSLLYDAVAMDRRFINREFYDIYRRIKEGGQVRGFTNKERNIEWVLPTPENRARGDSLDDTEKARLIGNGRAEICIFDLEADGSWDKFLTDMDFVAVVCDPLPSKMIQSAERFKILKKLELSGCKMKWIVSNTNGGVNKRQVSGYLKNSEILWIKSIAPEEIYGDEFACRFHWENKTIKTQLLEVFTKISHESLRI